MSIELLKIRVFSGLAAVARLACRLLWDCRMSHSLTIAARQGKRLGIASQLPIAYNASVSGQVAEIALASRDAITGILTRLQAGSSDVRVKRYGHRISGQMVDTLYRAGDDTFWVLHTSLTL